MSKGKKGEPSPVVKGLQPIQPNTEQAGLQPVRPRPPRGEGKPGGDNGKKKRP